MVSTAKDDISFEEVSAEGDSHSVNNRVSVGSQRGSEAEHQASSRQSQATNTASPQEPLEDQEEQNQTLSPRQFSQHPVNDNPLQPSKSRGRFDAVFRTKWDLLLTVTATALFAVTVCFAQATFSASSMKRVR